ncbi:DNA sulfur modification protein DndD [Halobacteria archaeon AArc-curdl1]|uniref:DNA sulfur modification protein DndD n=1 Tax=Natronosalvus hydrolyticus TaxID=2979988 RepID=A0AAP2Z8F1_9EURY|nr:DNA sulfur modification protein DndD [Halobacteria archaeon AArc-curdl1]
MKLTKLVINDFGPYRGRNEFTLTPSQDSPIILFGGSNGAGKTTLFRGVQICLHGRSALGRRVSEADYKEHIRGKLHEYPDQTADEASIRLEFEYAYMGEVDHYSVERSWRDRGKTLVENLEVRRNGKLPSDLDKDQWEDFLKELIPPGVSQLFFFDGEKVQELATAIEDDETFEDSLFSLLGLDLVDRLDADLSIYRSRKLDESGLEGVTEEINELREEKEELENREQELKDEKNDKEERLADLEREIDSKEADIAQEGGAYADKREELKERRAELNAKIENVEEDIRKIVTDAYPFALAPDLCQSVVNRLEDESEKQETAAARERLDSELDDALNGEVFSDLDVPEDKAEKIKTRLQSEIRNRFQVEDEDTQLLHQFSEAQRREMYAVVDKALKEVPENLGSQSSELESMVRELQDNEEQLGRAPEEEDISPLIEDLNDLIGERESLKSDIEGIGEELGKLDTRISRLGNQIDNKLDQKDNKETVSERADLASGVQDVLSEYREELAKEKLRNLEDALTERYLALSNKSDFYEGIEVDEDALNIKVKTKHGNHKPQSELSAGERQIFATALLWALAEISGRPLPFIVDTPLGRLDKAHRENLVENFFPEAAHQVLVFSTDTEINDEYYDQLNDDVTQAYHLNYNQEEGYTSVSRGYFWSSSDQGDEIDLEVTQ